MASHDESALGTALGLLRASAGTQEDVRASGPMRLLELLGRITRPNNKGMSRAVLNQGLLQSSVFQQLASSVRACRDVSCLDSMHNCTLKSCGGADVRPRWGG